MLLKLEPISIEKWPFRLLGIAYGRGDRLQLEVLYSEHNSIPQQSQMQTAWKRRQASRGVPLVLVVLYKEKAYVCGPSGEDPAYYPNLDPGQVERICQEALEQPTRQAALRSLRDSLSVLEEEGLPGLRNEGFLATHELISGVPSRSDWIEAGNSARKILGQTGTELIKALGYSIQKLDTVTNILKVKDHKTAIAVLLTEQESPESGSVRIPGTISPVSYAMARADEENLDWVILLHGRKIRLYPVKTGVGVGRRGRTETYIECHTALLPDEQAAYLWLLFSADALARGGRLASILDDSRDFAGELASSLRERIYNEVIPMLAEGLAQTRGIKKPTAQELAETYQMAMRVLFRLLFVAYGEDKGLLPYRFNSLYRKRSLKSKAKELMEISASGGEFGEGDTWWQEVTAIFHAVDKGNPSWGVPAYNGGLFSRDPDESPIGSILEEISLPDNVFGPALQQLLIVPTKEGIVGPVDFRSLGVREFGTIYEGLLESELSVAETDLAVETRGEQAGLYRPCNAGEEPYIPKGKIYLHNASGARKSTGSYYTKPFAVEHLLDKALEPALDDHFARLDKLDELEAAESFFDFRVADIAMGSGHFLVAAVDRIEARFSNYLAKRSLPQVTGELNHLRQAAREELGESSDYYPEFEDNALLRRLIARRCIYGVDINEVAVQLSRLALWIHTFVPGLPLSLLDRNLVHGNSLIGVGQISEIEEKVREEGSSYSFFEASAADFVGDARDALTRLGRLADATNAELKAARKAWADADKATSPAKALCDVLTAARIEGTVIPFDFTHWEEKKNSIFGGKEHKHALEVLKGMNVLHFPVAFPEVFLRDREGFDVILGNPPWEKARVEEHGFWARFVPGLRGLNQREREAQILDLRETRHDLKRELEREVESARVLRQALSRGPFPGMGTGDPDLYKAFCWRFWFLATRDDGRIGVVLPRSVLAAKGSEEFRWALFKEAGLTDITTLLNTSRWVFEMEPRYTVSLVAIRREKDPKPIIKLTGPFSSMYSYSTRNKEGGVSFAGEEVLSWDDSASLPLLPMDESIDAFTQLRKSPRLDLDKPGEWRARPLAEVHATNDKHLYDLKSESCPKGFWPVYKGASFDLWQPDTGEYYAWADPKVVAPILQEKRLKGHRSSNSVFHDCDSAWCADTKTLPCYFPRIAFRDVTNRTNRRTVICALIPPKVFVNHKAPYFVFSRGSIQDQLYLLGVFSSIPLDWYARRFVEVSLTFFVLNPFPVPRPDRTNTLFKRVVELSGRLSCPDDRYSEWAENIGSECGPLDENEKQDMIHELDAVVVCLYGLSQDQLVHIFETFHEGWDYNARLEATLKHFQKWRMKT